MVILNKNPFWWHPYSFASDSEAMVLDINTHSDDPYEGIPKPRNKIARMRKYKKYKKEVPFDIFLKLKEVCWFINMKGVS